MARITITELLALRKEALFVKEQAEELMSKLNNASTRFEAALLNIETDTANAKSKKEELIQIKAEADVYLKNIIAFESQASEASGKISELASKVDTLSENLKTKENLLDELAKNTEAAEKRIESLLPGATSAGLASAFRERKESFQLPILIWSSVFIASILTLFLIAILHPIEFPKDVSTADSIYKYLIAKFPYLIPIVWLAIYASKRHGQALRLEEEYAHKEVISKSFEGYKKQLAGVQPDRENPSPTELLTEKALDAIALHPGRVYDLKTEDITPISEIKEALSLKQKKPATSSE